MADLSKVKVLGTAYNLKDAKGRADLAALMDSLGNAAYKDVKNTLDGMVAGDIIDGVAIKAYVDAQVGAIHKFDVKVVDTLPTASADTMYILYLIPTPGATDGSKDEYITIRSGAEGSYTYAWELIGSTKPELADYVKKTQKVAGIDLQDDITVAELQGALELGALAYLDEGSVKVTTADSLTMDSYTPAGDVTLNDFTQTSTVATISAKADYTPAGSITGEAIKGGSINVTIKDAASATAVTDITYSAYTPAGAVTLEKAANGAFQVSGSVSKPAINVNDDSVDTFVKSLKAGDVDAASFIEGAFTPASIDANKFFSAGSQASYEHTGFDGGKLEKGTAVQAAIEGVVASVGAEGSEDAETLILTAAQKDKVMDFDASFTAATYGTDTFVANTLPSIDVANGFSGGSKAADTFSANKLPVVDGTASAVTAVTAELAAAPTFTGDKFNPAFAGTSADVKFAGAKYLKQEIDAKTFTPVAAELGFSGTKIENLIPTEVKYDKATANGASFSGTAEVLTGTINTSEKTIEVDFE